MLRDLSPLLLEVSNGRQEHDILGGELLGVSPIQQVGRVLGELQLERRHGIRVSWFLIFRRIAFMSVAVAAEFALQLLKLVDIEEWEEDDNEFDREQTREEPSLS